MERRLDANETFIDDVILPGSELRRFCITSNSTIIALPFKSYSVQSSLQFQAEDATPWPLVCCLLPRVPLRSFPSSLHPPSLGDWCGEITDFFFVSSFCTFRNFAYILTPLVLAALLCFCGHKEVTGTEIGGGGGRGESKQDGSFVSGDKGVGRG
jgi:hypothetical protein